MKDEPSRKEFNQISNEAKIIFFLKIIGQDNAIDDVNQSRREIKKIVDEVENNISIQGINATQYLCLYLEDIDIHMQILEDSQPGGFGNISIGSRLRILIDAYVHVHHFLMRINHLYGTSIYPKTQYKIKMLKKQNDEFEKKFKSPTYEIVPKIKPAVIQTIYDIFKDHFNAEDQPQLKEILEKGNNANRQLLFKDNGNRITDTFKKLFEHDFITGCQKKDLQKWIKTNFRFLFRGKIKYFTADALEKGISRNYYPCKKPLIEIVDKTIQKNENPRKKKYNKH